MIFLSSTRNARAAEVRGLGLGRLVAGGDEQAGGFAEAEGRQARFWFHAMPPWRGRRGEEVGGGVTSSPGEASWQ